MKKFGVKNIIIVFLCLTIIFLCVGFALLSKELEPGEALDVKIVVTYNPSTMISGLREFSYTVGLIAK